MPAANRVAKAALADWQSGGESRGQRSAVEVMETYLPGACWQVDTTSVVVTCVVIGESRKTGCRQREGSALWRSYDSGLPEKQTGLQPACRCDLRSQRAGSRLAGIAFFGSGNGTEPGLKTIQAMRVVGNDHFDWKRAGKSRKKASENWMLFVRLSMIVLTGTPASGKR